MKITNVILLALLMASCAPMYIPNKVNTPLFSEAGELQMGGYLGTSGFDPQVNYAVTDHIGLMFNGSFQAGNSDSTEAYNDHQFYELGAGYYTKFSEIGRFEVFGGYGFGNVKARYDNGFFVDYSDASVQRFFIQPDVGISSKIIDASFALRFVVVNAQQNNLNLTRSFMEPAFTLKVGFKYVKFVWQFGFSLPFNATYLIEQQPFIGSIGIQGYINKRYAD
jgi:hypothetical protein